YLALHRVAQGRRRPPARERNVVLLLHAEWGNPECGACTRARASARCGSRSCAGRSDEPTVRTTFQANRAGNGARSSGCQLLRPEGTSETRTTGDARERRTCVQSSLLILRVQIGGLRCDRGWCGLDCIGFVVPP